MVSEDRRMAAIAAQLLNPEQRSVGAAQRDGLPEEEEEEEEGVGEASGGCRGGRRHRERSK